uniref:G_PROTEIN_RECEP_F1_2 domain-containing protein n=1 Tax=Caenorhabditis tropicalis TaxID=1561998 RepID=A0A1I7TUJ2_9PELO
MSLDIELTNDFRLLHLIFGGIGVILNSVLLLIALFETPQPIRLYSTLIINFALTDALACILDIFIEIRVLPYPNEDSMAHIMNGPCKYLGKTTCAIGFSLYLHTLTHSIWSLLISFGYRYLVLFNTIFKRKMIILVIMGFYFPSFLQAITYWSNFVDRSEILPIVRRVHPDYDLSENVGLLTGITDLTTPSVIYGMAHTTLMITPVYISLFIIRWKIVKILTKDQESMSRETKQMHRQLLKVLTLQAILPATSFGTSYLFMGSLSLENVCDTVNCAGGQSVCHQTQIPCDPLVGKCNTTRWCFSPFPCNITVPYCSQKNQEDYKRELDDSKTPFELTRLNNSIVSDAEKELLCKGIKCFGLGQCTVSAVPCVESPDCLRYLPTCDDSPALGGAKRLKRKLHSSDQYKGPLSWTDQLLILLVFLAFGLVFLLVFLFLRCLERCSFIPK